MKSTVYGYVRVSTKGQKEDRQLDAMQEFGVPAEYIVIEKQSGKDFARPAYLQLVEELESGDVLVIKSIDRLGRNYTEILEQWASLTREKKVSIVVLDMPLLDTRERRDLTGTLIADIVLQLLSYVAQTEREFIRQRQAEGIAAAKARGVSFGPKRIPMPDTFEELAEDWWFGRTTAIHAGQRLGISRSTFTRRAEEWRLSRGLPVRPAPRSDPPLPEAEAQPTPRPPPLPGPARKNPVSAHIKSSCLAKLALKCFPALRSRGVSDGRVNSCGQSGNTPWLERWPGWQTAFLAAEAAPFWSRCSPGTASWTSGGPLRPRWP